MKRLQLFSLISCLALLSACEKAIINHGYIIDKDAFKRITIGKDDARTVYAVLGAPTMRSSVIANDGSHSWYYVSKITEKVSFRDPVVIDQKTMVVTFDNKGIVKSVKESTYEKPISVVSDKTQSGGKTSGVFGETFGGMGRYLKHYSDKK